MTLDYHTCLLRVAATRERIGGRLPAGQGRGELAGGEVVQEAAGEFGGGAPHLRCRILGKPS